MGANFLQIPRVSDFEMKMKMKMKMMKKKKKKPTSTSHLASRAGNTEERHQGRETKNRVQEL